MDYDIRKFQSKVEQASMLSGAGTELVTVWIPPGANLDSTRSRLQGERSEAGNIKSKRTRERVRGALERALNILHKYEEVPENGLVVCSGYVPNTDEYVTFTFDDLPEPIRDSKYECGDEFVVDELLKMAFGGSEWWGLVTVTRDSAALGRYANDSFEHVDVIDAFDSHVQGKFKAGGQSAQRLARRREKQQENHYKKVVDIARNNFDPDDDDFMGMAVGGPNVTVSDFIEWLPQRLEEEIVTIETVDHAGSRESLLTLAEAAEPAFEEVERQHERNLVEDFKRGLSGEQPVVYGPEQIDTAIDYGAVDTLLISADLGTEYIDDQTERVRNQGGDVVIISTMHEQGDQLLSVFGGEAAFLRFDIE